MSQLRGKALLRRQIFPPHFLGDARSSGHTARGGEHFVNDIAGIARSGWLEKENFGFRLSHRAVLDAAWNDAKLTALQHHVTIAKLNGHLPAPNEKHFVFAFVVMPWEHASKLDQLHFLAIQLGYDLWPPMFLD